MADALLTLTDVARTFDVSPPWLDRVLERRPRTLLTAVDGVTLAIARGETLGLVGESGCGKSTVARLIVGLHAPTRGTVAFDGTIVAGEGAAGGAAQRAARRGMQMIFQDPYASLNPRWRVDAIVAEPIRVQEPALAREPEQSRHRLVHAAVLTRDVPAPHANARVGRQCAQPRVDPAPSGLAYVRVETLTPCGDAAQLGLYAPSDPHCQPRQTVSLTWLQSQLANTGLLAQNEYLASATSSAASATSNSVASFATDLGVQSSSMTPGGSPAISALSTFSRNSA